MSCERIGCGVGGAAGAMWMLRAQCGCCRRKSRAQKLASLRREPRAAAASLALPLGRAKRRRHESCRSRRHESCRRRAPPQGAPAAALSLTGGLGGVGAGRAHSRARERSAAPAPAPRQAPRPSATGAEPCRRPAQPPRAAAPRPRIAAPRMAVAPARASARASARGASFRSPSEEAYTCTASPELTPAEG